MLMFNLFTEHQFDKEVDLEPALYPDEVLESEWNPVLDEIHSTLHLNDTSSDETGENLDDEKSMVAEEYGFRPYIL
ncbi:MAG: hypothetical protein KZQ90_20490 [Candidatus Thiodiazotropha sp. (ex Codakia rugifera)]|nr:hypothetical protein [Candidatus Thiodiazotropha sp. (ex Codakia rugifera)]